MKQKVKKYLEILNRCRTPKYKSMGDIRKKPLWDRLRMGERLAEISGKEKAQKRLELMIDVYDSFNMSWRLDHYNRPMFIPPGEKIEPILEKAKEYGMEFYLGRMALFCIRNSLKTGHLKSYDPTLVSRLRLGRGHNIDSVAKEVFDLLKEKQDYHSAVLIAGFCNLGKGDFHEARGSESWKRQQDNAKGVGEEALCYSIIWPWYD